MDNLRELYAKREGLTREFENIYKNAEAEGRVPTSEEETRLDILKAQADDNEKMIARAEQLAEMRRNQPAAMPIEPLKPAPPAKSAPVVESVRERILDKSWSDMGEFAKAVFNASPAGTYRDPRLDIGAAASGMNRASGADGGFLVPPSFAQQIFERFTGLATNLVPMTDTYTVTGESLTFNAVNETSRAAGSRWGGVRGYWIAEAAQITSSKPTFRQVKVEPQQVAALIYVTDKLLGSAGPALGQFLSRAAADELAFLASDAIINGTGVGQPKGILNSGCVVSVAKETGQGAATILAENIGKMWARLHPRSKGNAVWLINTECQPQLDNLQVGIGTSGQLVYMPPGGLSASPYGTLKGRPVYECESCSALGTVGDIILADLSGYLTGIKGGIESAISMHLRFDYAETAFRFMYEIDGQPWLVSAITPFKGTSTLSTFVTLATRS